MHKFKYDDGSDGVTYETLDELLSLKIDYVTEHDGYYFVFPPREGPYDNTVYKVDKKTGKAVYIPYIDYMLNIEEKAKPVDPKTIKGVS